MVSVLLVSKWHFLSFFLNFPFVPILCLESYMARTGHWWLCKKRGNKAKSEDRLTRQRKCWDSWEAYLTPNTVTPVSGPSQLDTCQSSESSHGGHVGGSLWLPGTSREALELTILTVNHNGRIKVENHQRGSSGRKRCSWYSPSPWC